MLPHVRKEHAESIKDKYLDLSVMSPEHPYFMEQLTQLVKALAIYIVKKEIPND